MKKGLCVFLTLLMLLTASGCGGKTEADGQGRLPANSVETDEDGLLSEMFDRTELSYVYGLESPNVEPGENGYNYYIITGDYEGEYSLNSFYPKESDYNRYSISKKTVLAGCLTRQEYEQYCGINGFETEFSDESRRYVVLEYPFVGCTSFEVRLADVIIRGDTAELLVFAKEESSYAEGVEQMLGIEVCSLVVPVADNVRFVDVIPVASYETIDSYLAEYEIDYCGLKETETVDIEGLESPNFAPIDGLPAKYVITGDYDGEFSLNEFYYGYDYGEYKLKFEVLLSGCLDLQKYLEYCGDKGIEPQFNDNDCNYAVMEYACRGCSISDIRLADVLIQNGNVILPVYDNVRYNGTGGYDAYSIVVPVPAGVTDVKIVALTGQRELISSELESMYLNEPLTDCSAIEAAGLGFWRTEAGAYNGEYSYNEFIPRGNDYSKYADYGTVGLTYCFSYDEYIEYCGEKGFEPEFTDESRNYAILECVTRNGYVTEVRLTDVQKDKDTVLLLVKDEELAQFQFGNYDYFLINPDYLTFAEGLHGYVIVVPVDSCVTKAKYLGLIEDESEVPIAVAYKPVIYIYPEEETGVEVRLTVNGSFTSVYPAFDDFTVSAGGTGTGSWKVTAEPDGDLHIGEKTYNYLFWEAESRADWDFSRGFCVKGGDTEAFLEEYLLNLGLNEHEANEFIVFWLPLMQNNRYNVISFQTEVYEDYAKLGVLPEPDTMIRVFMAWYASDTEVKIETPKLETPERTGYTIVEWGGTEIAHT